MKLRHQSRAITLLKMNRNIVQSSKSTSCQYKCIYKIWWKSTSKFTRYWASTKFWCQSSAITLLKIDQKWRALDTTLILYISMHIQNFINIHPFVLKILRKNTFLHQSRAIILLFINKFSPFAIPNHSSPISMSKPSLKKTTPVRVRKWSADIWTDGHSK